MVSGLVPLPDYFAPFVASWWEKIFFRDAMNRQTALGPNLAVVSGKVILMAFILSWWSNMRLHPQTVRLE